MNTSLAKTPGTAALTRHTTKVLLVDDDSFQLEMISGMLEDLGLTDITQASSGEKGLQAIANKQNVFNLLVIDLHMPRMDGFQFMEAAAKAGYSGALIIVSGQSDDVLHAASMVAQLRRFTLLGVVAKPVGRAALQALITKLA